MSTRSRRLAPLLLAIGVLTAAPLGAQIVRPGDLPRAADITECGWSDALPATGLDDVAHPVYANVGVVRYERARDHAIAGVWQVQGGSLKLRGCYRLPELRVQLFGSSGGGFGARIEGERPLKASFPLAPAPQHMEVPRFVRLQIVAGLEASTPDLLSVLGAEQRRAWAGLLAASPRLELGWAGEPRILGRLVITGEADAFGTDDFGRVRPRLGVNLPLLVARSHIVGVLATWDRTFRYAPDADLTTRVLTLTMNPLAEAADWITIGLQVSDRRLGHGERLGAVGLHATLFTVR